MATQGEKGWGRERLGIWNNICKLMYKINKQQGPTIVHKELYLISFNKPIKENNMKAIYICITESLCCIPGTNKTL